MKFLILSRLPEVYSTRRLVQEVIARDHELFLEHPDAEYNSREDELVLPRLGIFGYEQSIRRLISFSEEKPHIFILNPPHAFHRARHKGLACMALKNLPQPLLLKETTRFPVVLKDCLSGQGQGVFLCHDEQELKEYQQKLKGREFILQEFIADSAGQDVRAFVIGSQITAAIERTSYDPKKEFRSNLSLGGSGSVTALSSQEEQLCLQAVAQLGLYYAGVDFMRSDRGPLLLEVNPCPGFEGIEKYTGLNIAKEIVLYAESLFSSYSQ